MKKMTVALFTGLLLCSFSTITKKSVAYTYIDGNNNTYEISSSLLNYIPIDPKNSSSGTYSGGEAKQKAITEQQFSELEKIINTILKDKKYLEDNREMGFGTILIGNKAKFIHRDSPTLKNLNTHLQELLAS